MAERKFEHGEANQFLINLNFLPIPTQDRCLLALIAFRNQMGYCKHSNAKMGQILGCDRTSIANQLRRLVKDGYVEVINSGDPHNRAIAITSKTEKIMEVNTQLIIDKDVKFCPQPIPKKRKQKPVEKKKLDSKSEVDTGVEMKKFITKDIKISSIDMKKLDSMSIKNSSQNNTLKNNSKNNYEEIIEPDFPVDFQSPSKSGLKSIIEADQIKEVIKTEKGINEITPRGYTREQVLNAIEVFIAANDGEKYSSLGFLKSEFMDYVREYADMPF